MNLRIKNIISLIFGAVITLAMTACHHDIDIGKHNPNYRLAISISTIGSRADGSIIERIKSLRIIILDKDTVELNSHITLSDNPALGFSYTTLYHTYPGKKSFYLFANEESVDQISFINDNQEDDPQSLTSLLNSIKRGNKKEIIENIFEKAFFDPVYEETNGTIFLPYTAYYGGENGINVGENGINEGEKDVFEAEFFLVPAAAKFLFNFTNNRNAGIKVNGISVNYVNTLNYLFAQVGPQNQYMTLKKEDGTSNSLYWINWLKEVSALSDSHKEESDNQKFNQKYGWISDYLLPTEDYQPIYFITEGNQLNPGNNFTINGVTYSPDDLNEENPIPTEKSVGPFYVPESINFINPNPSSNDSDEDTSVEKDQTYYLTIDFEDTIEGNLAPEFEFQPIENLKALFRNTFVIINIVFNQGDVEIFAEIAPWDINSINGYVTEDNAPANNPFQ